MSHLDLLEGKVKLLLRDRWWASRCSKVQVFQDDQAGLRLAGYRGWQASCQQLSSAVAELAQTGRSVETIAG